MEGGVNSYRRYVVLLALLLLCLLVLLVWPTERNDGSPSVLTDTVYFSQLQDSSDAKSKNSYYRKRNSPYTYRHSHNEWQSYDTSPRRAYKPRQCKALVFELNSADTTDLQQLHGIGSVFARRIVGYRKLLGGFVRKEQLLEVYNLDAELYEKIDPYLTIDTTLIQKIDINSVTLQQLRKHPYLDYYQAKAIINLRTQHGPFESPIQLLNTAVIDQETYNKINPYITCNLQQSK